jgi:phosphate acyltransferase
MKIAVDAMGGDHAPEAIVEGAVQAASEYGVAIILVGPEDLVQKELEKYDTSLLSIEVKHASQVVDMHDLPSVALRRKRDSSLHVAINLIRQGEADAAVSAGNTGAAMAIGKLACRMLEGVERPALAAALPNIDGATIIIDVGANVDCKPIHLLQFAVMGHVYAREVFGIEAPRIGLLSTGEEETKGTVLTKEVFEPLREADLNFIGNAEGRDVFNGRADVIVCDGFTGNVVLKASESLAKAMGLILREGFSQSWRTKLGYLLVKPVIQHLRKRTDYTEYGGAPLLGLNGIVIVSHGSSKAKALKNAIRVAGESANHGLHDRIAEAIAYHEFDVKSRKRATSFWHQLKETIRHDSDKGKHAAEKSERAEESSVPVESDQPVSLAPDSESSAESKSRPEEEEKPHWWHLKDTKSHESSSPEPSSDEADFQHQSLKAAETPESEAPEEAPTETDEQQENKPERKPWWLLGGLTKHHDTQPQQAEKSDQSSAPESESESVKSPEEHSPKQE